LIKIFFGGVTKKGDVMKIMLKSLVLAATALSGAAAFAQPLLGGQTEHAAKYCYWNEFGQRICIAKH
jgi:hypothetical protein